MKDYQNRCVTLTARRRIYLTWMAAHPGATMRELAQGNGVTMRGGHDAILALRELGLITLSGGKARQTALTAAGWAALGRAPACPTCHRPILTTGETL